MTDEQIKNALTEEEWADPEHHVKRGLWWVYEPEGMFPVAGVGKEGVQLEDIRHAVAALCLYQQPFGFDAADVAVLEKLNGANDYAEGDSFGVLDVEITPEETTRLRSLASRIAALLPPPKDRI